MKSEDFYRLLMVISGMDQLKVNIIHILSHLPSQRLSGVELTHLLGYSPKARTIYRGVLTDLETDNLINIEKHGNQYSISINRSHPITNDLIELSMEHGTSYTNQLLDMLEEVRS